MENGKDKLQLLLTMMLFGTIGTLSRYIDMPSSIICLGRAFFGVIIILSVLAAAVSELTGDGSGDRG